MAGDERLRLFFALPLDEALREAACGLQEELGAACDRRTRVKWVERPNLHLTLKFLGDMPRSAIGELARVAETVATDLPPMALKLGGTGCFPPRGAPRIVWLGLVHECPELAELARSLDAALAEAGLAEVDPRPFTAHFTLGRVRAGGHELREAAEALGPTAVGEMMAAHFALLSSDLTPRGPIYTEERRFRLGG